MTLMINDFYFNVRLSVITNKISHVFEDMYHIYNSLRSKGMEWNGKGGGIHRIYQRGRSESSICGALGQMNHLKKSLPASDSPYAVSSSR